MFFSFVCFLCFSFLCHVYHVFDLARERELAPCPWWLKWKVRPRWCLPEASVSLASMTRASTSTERDVLRRDAPTGVSQKLEDVCAYNPGSSVGVTRFNGLGRNWDAEGNFFDGCELYV